MASVPEGHQLVSTWARAGQSVDSIEPACPGETPALSLTTQGYMTGGGYLKPLGLSFPICKMGIINGDRFLPGDVRTE